MKRLFCWVMCEACYWLGHGLSLLPDRWGRVWFKAYGNLIFASSRWNDRGGLKKWGEWIDTTEKIDEA